MPKGSYLVSCYLNFDTRYVALFNLSGPSIKSDDSAGFPIPHNSAGIPLFPAVEFNQMVLGDIRALLEKYFGALWRKYI